MTVSFATTIRLMFAGRMRLSGRKSVENFKGKTILSETVLELHEIDCWDARDETYGKSLLVEFNGHKSEETFFCEEDYADSK